MNLSENIIMFRLNLISERISQVKNAMIKIPYSQAQ